MMKIKLQQSFLVLCLFVTSHAAQSQDLIEPRTDPHYTDVGFFDIHVCNWPERPLFFLTLFSTTFFDRITRIEILDPQDRPVGDLNLEKFRLFQIEDKKNKAKKIEKRVFITLQDIPKGSGDGWYKAIVHTRDGKKYLSRDYVIMHEMQRATGLNPAPGAENVPLVKELSWDPIPGAKHYRVFIWDDWENKTIMESKVLDEPRLVLPKDLIQPGGLYTWQVHARDVNENILLGDFNHGSLTRKFKFSVAE